MASFFSVLLPVFCNLGWLNSSLPAWFLHQRRGNCSVLQPPDVLGRCRRMMLHRQRRLDCLGEGNAGIPVLPLNRTFGQVVLDFEGFPPPYACILIL